MSTELPQGSKKIELKKDKRYSICTCGLSNIMPYCDGNHREQIKNGCQYKSLKIISDQDVSLTLYSTTWVS